MVRVDKPALLISGEWDPATSPRWARVTADQFSRSQIVIVRKEGHILDRLDACVGAMTREFLETDTRIRPVLGEQRDRLTLFDRERHLIRCQCRRSRTSWDQAWM